MLAPKSVCISHGEDADGLICAAYLRRLRDAPSILVTYDELPDALRSLEPPLDELYICDLNIREGLLDEILRVSGFARVTLVDHHPTAGEILEELGRSGVTVVHSSLDCAGALLYDHFRGELGREGARLAAYAAISDQFEEGPIASRLLLEFDRQFVQHEALILNHALFHSDTADFRSLVVDELSRFAFPHRIRGVEGAALAHLEHMAVLLETLPEAASRRSRLAHVEAPGEASLGAVAGLLIDAMGVDVGVCYRKNGDALNVSIRSRRGLEFHLGELTKRLAERYGGFGGGHKRASGASIPQQSLMSFICDLESELPPPPTHGSQ